MSNGSGRCNCPRCMIRSMIWPAVVITAGVLFLLHEMRGGAFEISNTYPFLLIVIGGILLASSVAPMTGHVEPVGTPPPVPPPSTPATGATPSSLTGPGR